MVQLVNGLVLIMGAGNFRTELYIFNPTTEEFSRSHDMPTSRDWAGCTTFHSQKHSGRPVVVIGGGESGGNEDDPNPTTFEILDYTQPGSTWEKGMNSIFT